MGQSSGKNPKNPKKMAVIQEEQLETYIRSEFRAIFPTTNYSIYRKNAKKMAVIPEEQLETYIRSEFLAMDPVDGSLNRQQVLDLLIMLGYSKGKEKLKALHVKNEDSVELEDYVTAFKADKTLISKTCRYRDVFKYFDTNNDGTASKEEILTGLEGMDIKVDEKMRATVEKMDSNQDGKISYEEYLRMEFKMALNRGKKGSKK